MQPPNIIFVFADQMRAQATGYAGDPNVKTPYLDQLAGESANFVNATSNCPVCTPYRGCLLTGQYPLTHGLFMNDLCLPDNGHSIGHELGRAGYTTAWIGKWHLDGHGRKAYIPRERRQGFDYWKVLECTHDYNQSQYYDGDDETPRFWDGYDANAQTDDACAYIREDAGSGSSKSGRPSSRARSSADASESPFALFLSFGTPHDPYDTAPDDLKALYSAEELVLRDNVPAHRAEIARRQLEGYYAHITAIDRCMQQIDETLRDCGIAESTILVFTSDHGDMLESQWHTGGQRRGVRKQVPYDEAVLVPLLLRYPAKLGATRRQITTPLATPDIMPTLLTLAGLPVPSTVEGMDLSPLLAAASVETEGSRRSGGAASPARTGVLIASYHPFADWRSARGGRPYRGIRTERYTFVRDRNGPWLLFDNAADPFQLDNRVNQSAFAHIQSELDTELSAMLAEQNDTFERPEDLRRRFGYEVDDREEIPIR